MKLTEFLFRYRRSIGPVATLVAIVILELAAGQIQNYRPGSIALQALIFFSVLLGGLRSGLVSAVLQFLYRLYYMLDFGHPYNEAPEQFWTIVFWIIVNTFAVLAMAWLMQRWHAADARRIQRISQDYDVLLESSSDAVFIMGSDRRYLSVNQKACAMTGYSREELLTMGPLDLIDPDTAHTLDTTLALMQKEGKYLGEQRFKRKNGTLFYVEISAKVLNDGRALGIVRDISDRKRREQQLYESEQRFRALIENSSDVVTLVDQRGTILYTSASIKRLLGYETWEISGRSAFDFIQSDADTVQRIFESVRRRENRRVHLSVPLRHKNGSIRWVEFSAINMFHVPFVQAIVTNYHDITERRFAQEALRQSEYNLSGVIENTTDSIYSVDRNLRVVVLNSAFRVAYESAYGVVLQPGMAILEYLPKATADEWRSYYQRALEGERFVIEKLFEFAGISHYYDISFYPLRDAQHIITGVSVFSRDVTERMQSRKMISDSEIRYRQMFENNTAIKWLVEPESGRIVDANPAAAAFYGYTVDQLKSLRVWDINVLPEKEVRERIAQAMEAQQTYVDFRHRLANGEIKEVEVRTGPVVIGERKLLFSIIHDVTERRKVEQALIASENKYRSIFENITEGIYQATEEGNFITINPALVRMLGYKTHDEVMRLNLNRDIYVRAEDRLQFNENTRAQGIGRYAEVFWRKKDGAIIQVRLHDRAVYDTGGRFLYYEVAVEDITESRRLEQNLIQAQKMESVGRIAGGVAHDMNNMLAVILPTAEMLKNFSASPEMVKTYAENIAASARRAGEIVKQLLVYARQTPLRITRIHINDLIRETQAMVTHAFPKQVRFDIRLDDSIPAMDVDQTQIQQVIMNLLVNARDAMGEPGGLINVRTHSVEFDGESAELLNLPGAGVYIECIIRDSGVGMDAGTLQNIFEAFYTTKPEGQGTGLGLAVAKSIILNHGGTIMVDSKKGEGAEFRFYLPASRSNESAPVPEIEKPLETGKETVLVVDDEKVILNICSRILEELGYRVITAQSGMEAVRLYQQEKPDVVMLDIQMPEMDGKQTHAALCGINPMAKIFFATGYATPDVVRDIRQNLKSTIIEKPFSIDTLSKVIRTLLDQN